MIRAMRLPCSVALFAPLLLIVSIAAAGTAAEATAPRRSVTLDDMNKTKWPGIPRISADGKQVAYAVDRQIYA